MTKKYNPRTDPFSLDYWTSWSQEWLESRFEIDPGWVRSYDEDDKRREARLQAACNLQDAQIRAGLPDLSEDESNALEAATEQLIEDAVEQQFADIAEYESIQKDSRYWSRHHTGRD